MDAWPKDKIGQSLLQITLEQPALHAIVEVQAFERSILGWLAGRSEPGACEPPSFSAIASGASNSKLQPSSIRLRYEEYT